MWRWFQGLLKDTKLSGLECSSKSPFTFEKLPFSSFFLCRFRDNDIDSYNITILVLERRPMFRKTPDNSRLRGCFALDFEIAYCLTCGNNSADYVFTEVAKRRYDFSNCAPDVGFSRNTVYFGKRGVNALKAKLSVNHSKSNRCFIVDREYLRPRLLRGRIIIGSIDHRGYPVRDVHSAADASTVNQLLGGSKSAHI